MEVKINRLDHFGRGISSINNKIVFIEDALPNEIVEIEIIKETSKYLEAKTINIKEKSPIRIEEECPYSKVCGGCNLNHICFNEENKFKQDKIKSILSKINIPSNVIESIAYHDRNHYRNKITLHGNKEILGLYEKKSNEIIPIKECILVNDKINEIIKVLNKETNKIEEAIIKTSNDNSNIMVSITGEISNIDELKNISNVLIINNEYLTKDKEIKTKIGEKYYYVGINSFFQVNNTLTKELYDEVLNNIKGKNYNTVLDLYCGTGTIGIYISNEVNKVIGIDYNESNIHDASKNKELNSINNIEFICDKVENQIDKFNNIDCIIVDPPRAGLDKKTINYLKKINPKKIIYVSCDIMTLSRDLKELQEEYNIVKVKPFNMFPRTYHVETVSVLCRKTFEK